jgi:hypothetical protein
MIYDPIEEWAIWESDWQEDRIDPDYFYLVIADEILNRLSKASGLGFYRFLPAI